MVGLAHIERRRADVGKILVFHYSSYSQVETMAEAVAEGAPQDGAAVVAKLSV